MRRQILILAVVLVFTAAMGFYGIHRCLWLDEAWVANSVRASSLTDLFYYPEWLQTSPPLFLLLVRAMVTTSGLSAWSLRAVPLALAMVSLVAFFSAARRVLSWPFAGLACALIAAHPMTIEYSRTLKQYTGEMASATILLWAAIRYFEHKRFEWLMGLVCVVALPLAYASVFLLPGLLISLDDRRRAAKLAAAAGAISGLLYCFFIRPNYSPELRAFWAVDEASPLNAGLVAALLVCGAAAVWLATRRAWGLRDRVLILCVSPCLLLAASAAAGWYPANPRTRLFLLPCFVLLAVMILERSAAFLWWCALPAGALVLVFSALNQIRQHRDQPMEDYQSALALLRDQLAPDDRLLVHASAREGFELYTAMGSWRPDHVAYGDTGWPCCARGKDARPGKSSAQSVTGDLDRLLSRDFRGRVWLLYTTRPTHWAYTGMNEGEFWRMHLWERGCPPGAYFALPNLAVASMQCVTRGPGGE